MTVKELIEILENHDPNLLVFVNGYEGGYNDVVKDPKNVEVILNYHEEWYYGKHENVDRVHPETKEKNSDMIVKGIVL